MLLSSTVAHTYFWRETVKIKKEKYKKRERLLWIYCSNRSSKKVFLIICTGHCDWRDLLYVRLKQVGKKLTKTISI